MMFHGVAALFIAIIGNVGARDKEYIIIIGTNIKGVGLSKHRF